MEIFLKKNWLDIVLVALILVVLIPQTRMPIQVFLQRFVSTAPSEIDKGERIVISDFTWELVSLDGNMVAFDKSEGKVILVNFWATWCPPCVAEMPSLQELYNTYGAQVDFYFVTSETPEVARQFLQNTKYTFPVFLASQWPPKEIQTQTIPTTYLISKKREIVVKEKGAANWNDEKVLKIMDDLLLQ